MERDFQAVKEEILARSDIVDIIGMHTRLKRAGKNWTGLCPFHADKKPSFNVNAEIKWYRCWSCGEKGSLIDFVMKKEGLEFIEALEWLARRAGLPFERPGRNPEKASEREEMLALNELAARFFQDRLTKSEMAQEYLVRRSLLRATQEQWRIGFAPDDWEGLAFYLQRHRANLELAAKIGLIKPRKQEGSGYYDAFRNRVIFPIHDIGGRLIAFGGRALGDDPAKYLNSEQSAIFDKSRTLYGLHFARKKLSGDTAPVFVEGYVDVITAHQAGFTQCVATLGTSMTEEHARMLVRYNPRVLICYDADAAGVKATLRGASVWEGIGVEGAEVRVARLPAGDDPDSLLRRGETAAFQAALDHAMPRVDFQIELVKQKHDVYTEEGRDAALAEILPILASIPSLTQRDRYAQRLAYLHPSHSYSIGRAVEQILADAASFAARAPEGGAAREKGYPPTEGINRGPVAEQPSPPVFRPESRKPWGEWPNTRQVIRRNNGGNEQDYRRSDRNYDKRDRYRRGPVGEPTPPVPQAGALSGVEKAERQLLRALFSPEWRVFILSRAQPELCVTPAGRRLFEQIARTPATEEGRIDPLPLLQEAQAEEEEEARALAARIAAEPSDSVADIARVMEESAPRKAVKISEFIRELLEDSPFLVPNDRLNEAAVSDCIRRLEKHQAERAQRGLAEMLQHAEALSPEERAAYIHKYHQMVREARGSGPAAEE